MKRIIIKTQKQMDKQPEKFVNFTILEIRAKVNIFVRFARENSSVEAWENSSVEAWGNSSVVAWENSSVVAWENSSVEAWENSSVVARENSSVVAWENSSVEAWENSSVVAWENSSVVAWENSSVVARENSSVVARGNSSVVAWENSSVVAWENSSVEAWGNCVIRSFSAFAKLKLKQFSIAIGIGVKIKAQFKSKTATIINNPIAQYDKKTFLDIYKKNIQPDGRILLYKSTREDDTDFWSGKIKYKGMVKCPVWDNDKNRECGDGLHLSPTPMLAKSFNNGKIKKCLVKKKDFVVYPKNISKVRCKEVEVLED